MADLPGDGAGGFGAIATGVESIAAALQLFDLCKPAESGATIALSELEAVLRQHVGETHDIQQVLRPLRSENGQTSMGDGRVDFLSYWQCMDSFFREISGGAPGRLTEAAVEGETDTIRGMRRFRDGVLDLWRSSGSENIIAAAELKALLSEIRDASDDPSYWEEVMQAVPCEGGFGLSLSEVAEAVCVWLRDVVREEEEEEEEEDEDNQEAKSEVASMPDFSRGDQSPRFSLKSELRRADKDDFASPPTSPQVPFGEKYHRRSSLGDLRGGALHRDSLGVAPSSEILRAQELAELMRRGIDASGDVPSQRALQKLNLAHDGIARQLQQQESELHELRRSNDSSEKRMKRMEEELSHAHESHHELNEKSRQLEEYMRKASALELELDELRQHLGESQQETQKMRAQAEEAEQKAAEAKKRDWQLRDRIESLEELEANAEGQLKWLRSELDARGAELEEAKKQLQAGKTEEDKSIASLKAATDSLAKVQQELAASKRCEADLRSQASDTKRASLVEQSTAAALHKDLAQLKQELDESKSAEQSLRTQLQAAEQLAAEAKQKELLQAKELQELQGLEQELRVQLAAARQASATETDRTESALLQERLQAAHKELEASKSREAELKTESQTLQAAELKKAQSREEDFQKQLKALQEELESSKAAARTEPAPQGTELTAVKEELETCKAQDAELRQQLGKSQQELKQALDQIKEEREKKDSASREADRPSVGGDKLAALESKVQLQQDQLKKLRTARDSILAAQQEIPMPAEDEDLSPRQMMSDRQCRFLSAQLRILLRHSQELEQLLDTPGDTSDRRKQSLQRVHEEGKRVFDELSEKLYTLEVQKNDVDEEVGRLQALVSDLETQLSSVKRQRDELKRSSAASTARPSEGPDLGVAIGQRSSKAFTAFTASVTSDTRSRASLDSPMQKPGTPSSSSDPAAFFGLGSRPTTELRSSPKTHLMQGVVKVLAPSTFINPDGQPKLAKKAKTPRSGKRTTRGDLEAFGVRPSLRHDDAEEESEHAWRRRPSQSVRRSQSAAAPSREDHLGTAGKLAARKDGLPQRMREMRRPDSECDMQ